MTILANFVKYNSFILFMMLLLLKGCGNIKNVAISEDSQVEAELIYQNKFDKNLDDWVVEQMEGGKVEIIDNKLEITDVSGCTIWLKQEFEGPIMIEYDVVVIDKGGPQDRVSDLNCFWMAKDPKNMENLFANSDKRGGKFSNYDSLRLYYMGVGGHFNTKTRFRRYTGNGERPLLPEHDLSDAEYLLTANEPYHIRIIAFNNYIKYYRNDQLLVDFYDPEPYTSGHFGFRTVNNHMTVDNFKVYKLSK
ncbi:farnesoic acid O-methyltransferase [Jejuia pallidilutea]|uniref:Farnesoic acid O-methyltransferase n=2 Tax=Jejuia pallidilutea TaxID=504487 RepID=A0A362X0C6_9FLAO|nr:farnesoic acid O-methyltransferase [Jejuia pallidilutea]